MLFVENNYIIIIINITMGQGGHNIWAIMIKIEQFDFPREGCHVFVFIIYLMKLIMLKMSSWNDFVELSLWLVKSIQP